MRNHTKLRAFELADSLAVLVYQVTQQFPRAEQFGLTSQMRRAAVSAASNIVEGCARSTQKDYLRFLDIALGSVKEVGYQASLAHRLGMLDDVQYQPLRALCEESARVLAGLAKSVRALPSG